jgi:hypothetical protein
VDPVIMPFSFRHDDLALKLVSLQCCCNSIFVVM